MFKFVIEVNFACLAASPRKTTSHGSKYKDAEESVDLSFVYIGHYLRPRLMSQPCDISKGYVALCDERFFSLRPTVFGNLN